MARPLKQGLDFFPFDVDFFSDEKLCVIAGEFGIKGEITTVKLLCAVYRNGYYIEWSELLKYKLLKELPGVSAELLESIIHRLVKWDFFDKGLFDSASILTSRGIQRRFQTICGKAHRKNAITEYNLLSDETAQSTSAPPVEQSQRKPQQKKVAKQSAPPAAKIAPQPQPLPISLEKSIPILLSDKIWHEPVCMRYSINSTEEFARKMEEFRQHCISMGKVEHKDLADIKRHFCSWLNSKKTKNKINQPKPQVNNTDYTYTGGFGGKDT